MNGVHLIPTLVHDGQNKTLPPNRIIEHFRPPSNVLSLAGFYPLLLSAILSIRKDPVVFLQIIALYLAYIFGPKFIFRPAFMLVQATIPWLSTPVERSAAQSL
jgi:hypothetical protein